MITEKKFGGFEKHLYFCALLLMITISTMYNRIKETLFANVLMTIVIRYYLVLFQNISKENMIIIVLTTTFVDTAGKMDGETFCQ